MLTAHLPQYGTASSGAAKHQDRHFEATACGIEVVYVLPGYLSRYNRDIQEPKAEILRDSGEIVVPRLPGGVTVGSIIDDTEEALCRDLGHVIRRDLSGYVKPTGELHYFHRR